MALKIAVLVNTPPTNTACWTDVRQSYLDSLPPVAPSAHIQFYDPVFEQKFPDPSKYDLIILSGGKADASSSEQWVLGVLEFVRNTVRDSPKTKILGICWGHQAVSRALGGEVRAVPTGPIADIQDIRLTEEGKVFFPFAAQAGSFRAPEFHVREVHKPGDGFIALAENHECFVNEANTILTIQSHPEIGSEMAKNLLLDTDPTYNGNLSSTAVQHAVQLAEEGTDGLKLLARIIEWIDE